MIIVIVGELDAYEYDRDRHLIYIDGSLAAMTFMLALETLGLSSCPINWSGVEGAAYGRSYGFARPVKKWICEQN